MKYTVEGIVAGKKFTLEVEAKSDKHAKELVYAHFGSKSGIRRVNVDIREVRKNE